QRSWQEILLIAMNGAQIEVEAQLAAGDGLAVDAVEVEGRQYPRLLSVRRVGIPARHGFLNAVAHEPQIEEVSVIEPGQIDFGTLDIGVIALDVVGVGKVLVGLRHEVPAEIPAGIEPERSLAADHRPVLDIAVD